MTSCKHKRAHVLGLRLPLPPLTSTRFRVPLRDSPAECALDRRLGFDVEMYATLLMPIFLFVSLLLLAFLLSPLAGRSWRDLTHWPQIWDLVVWLLLLQFPTISRKTLTVFDCVQFEDSWLLRSDPSLKCFEGRWYTWASVAACGAAFYCVGFPMLTWIVSRRFHKSNLSGQRLVQVLTRNCTSATTPRIPRLP